jgi:membrane-bound inhibitor of C-type lysozyme
MLRGRLTQLAANPRSPYVTPAALAGFIAVVSCGCAATPRPIAASFVCDGGKTIGAVFTAGNPARVELQLSDGRRLRLPQAMSASGARYANSDESLVFWNKGRTAFLEEAGHQSYSGCVQNGAAKSEPEQPGGR